MSRDERRLKYTRTSRAGRNPSSYLLSLQTILERAYKLQTIMAALFHSSHCADPSCSFDSCSQVKELFQHAITCPARADGGCNPCR